MYTFPAEQDVDSTMARAIYEAGIQKSGDTGVLFNPSIHIPTTPYWEVTQAELPAWARADATAKAR